MYAFCENWSILNKEDAYVFGGIFEASKASIHAPDEPQKPSNPLNFALNNLENVIATHGEVKYALYRKHLGWVGFKWGDVGVRPPSDEQKLLAEWKKRQTKKEKK